MARLLIRVFAVVAVAAGVGLISWAVSSTVLGEPIRPLFGLQSLGASASEILGWGAGIFALGVTMLILSYLEQDNPSIWDD